MMLKKGKKTRAWDNERRKLKKEFERRGITRCEINLWGCLNDQALTFAHIDKRRYLEKDELNAVVLACIKCHTRVELMPRLEMRKYLENIIKNRKK